MKAYVGQTRSRALIKKLVEHGVGECTVTGELPPRRAPYFHDNGAFRDYEAERPFRVNQWLRDIRWMRLAVVKPDFVVVPDLVAAGLKSLELSSFWWDETWPELRAYVVVQDGMRERDVCDHLETHRYIGVFVGGSLPWKLETSKTWVRFAHHRGLKLHIGRVGPPDRVRWARRIGADSIDSSLPVKFEEHLDPFLEALR